MLEFLKNLSYSLKFRIAVIIFTLEACMMAAVLGISLSHGLNEYRTQLDVNEKVTLNMLSDLSKIGLITGEYDDLQPYLEQVVKDPHIDIVFLVDGRSRVVVSSEQGIIGQQFKPALLVEKSNHIWRSQPIANAVGKLGEIHVRFSHEKLVRTSTEVLSLGITTALVGMGLIAFIGIAIGHLLTRRLGILANTAKSIAKGELNVRSKLSGHDEVAVVGNAFDQMADSVESNVRDLAHLADELEQRVEERTQELEVARDKAINADRSKSAFLANMSHEIRTPLTAIIGFSESLMDVNLSQQERHDSIQTIVRNGKHLLRIINDILDLSKVEADKLELEVISVELFEVLDDVESLVKLLAEDKGLSFIMDFNYPLPSKITNDPLRIKQILINLCNNAVKFTDTGEVTLRVQFLQDKDCLRFDVIDTGIGIRKERLGNLFKPFSQSDISVTRQYGGTGLGLHLSRKLCRLMGGSLDVVSQPGHGSQFTAIIQCGCTHDLTLVYDRPDTTNPLNQPMHALVPKLRGRVLVAEDNPDVQTLLSRYIKNTGAELILVDDGAQAVRKASKFTYDLILMDMHMPVKGGLDATRELRDDGYTHPIVALTANSLETDVENSRQAGCDEHISKPVDRAGFYRLLERYLKPLSSNTPLSDPLYSSLLDEEPEMIDLVERLVFRLPDTIGDIKELYAKRRVDELLESIHSLKGAAGSFGYEQLFELLKTMEQQLKNDSAARLEGFIEELDVLCSRMKAGIRMQQRAS